MALGLGLSESEIHSSEHTRRWSRRNPWCPAQWGHFIVDHGSLLLVLKGEEKHFDRPMKNLFEMSCGVEKICVLFKKLRGKTSEGTQIWVSSSLVRVLYQHLHQLVFEDDQSFIHKIFGYFFRMSELSVWFNTACLTVCPHSLSKPHRFHGISLCTAVCMETCNQEGERRWTWGSIRERDLGWQESSLLEFCGDRLWQCSGRKQQWRNLPCVFVQSRLVSKHELKGFCDTLKGRFTQIMKQKNIFLIVNKAH